MSCECRITWRMLSTDGMGYRRVADPGCEECEPEPEPLAMIVDRYLQPLHRQHVIVVRERSISRECWTGAYPEEKRVSLGWGNNRIGARGGYSIHTVNRPAVKVDGQWLRRDPNLVVMA